MTLIYEDFLNPVPTPTPAPRAPDPLQGDTVTAEALAAILQGTLPVAPLDRNVRRANLPETLVITKLVKSDWYPGVYTMHYYCPVTGQRTYRDINSDTKLKILTGPKSDELSKAWATAAIQKLGTMGRRLVCTMGTDPEIFVVNNDNEIIPAWTYLPDKKAPLLFNKARKTGTAYWDGFQAEFTTEGKDTCLSWVIDNVHAGLQTVHDAAKAVGGKLTIDSVLPVNPDVLQTEEQEHVQFGCAPSYNVYDLRGNIEDGRNVPFRFAGGHLHFGNIIGLSKQPEARQKKIETYVKALDRVLAVAVVSMLGELDNPIRRKFYGLPGEYRMPSHGFEYRTLSNAWMCHPLAMNMVFDLARSVCGLAEEGFLETWQCTEDEMKEIVIENDVEKARAVLDRNKDMFKQILKCIGGSYYFADPQLEQAFGVWRNGIATVVEDPRDLVKNWNLDQTGGKWVEHSDGLGKCWNKSADYIKTKKL